MLFLLLSIWILIILICNYLLNFNLIWVFISIIICLSGRLNSKISLWSFLLLLLCLMLLYWYCRLFFNNLFFHNYLFLIWHFSITLLVFVCLLILLSVNLSHMFSLDHFCCILFVDSFFNHNFWLLYLYWLLLNNYRLIINLLLLIL